MTAQVTAQPPYAPNLQANFSLDKKIIFHFFLADETQRAISLTQHMFDLLTGTAIAFVSTMIYNCLKKYNENVTKTTIRFEGADHVESEMSSAFPEFI